MNGGNQWQHFLTYYRGFLFFIFYDLYIYFYFTNSKDSSFRNMSTSVRHKKPPSCVFPYMCMIQLENVNGEWKV